MITIDYAMRVATQLQNEGKLEQAKIILNSILAAEPTHAYALHLSGIIAYQSGQVTSGVEFIQQAIESNSAVALFHSNLGEIYRQLKNIELSIQHGQRAVALEPTSATALSNLGIAYYDAQQYEQAEDCHKRALAFNPNLSCSLNNMGSIYKTYGKSQQAIAFYQAAIAASPNFIEPLNNLGALFLMQQEFKQAFECFKRAMILVPTFADVQCNMGLTLLELGQYREAMLHFEKALQYKPDYAEVYYGIAKVYLRQHNFSQAEHYLHKAIAINPQQLEFYQLLAEIEHNQGNHEKALAHLDYALSMKSDHASLHISKGSILMEMGEISSAEAQFLKVSEDLSAETRVFAHYSLVQLRKIQADSPSLQALLALASNAQEIPSSKQTYLYFALGKCYNDMGEWAKAFAYFAQGCNLKRKQITYQHKEQEQFADKLIRCFNQETIESLRAFANSSQVPIFIVGMPRSGSTLVEQVLASHPSVYGAGELTYLSDLIQKPGEDLNYPENICQLTAENFRDITDKYLFYLRRISADAMRITDKMPQNFTAIGLIHALFPNAKIIHIKRNAIDTCLSCYTKLFSEGHHYSYDLAELGQYYKSYERIMDHWRCILPADAFLEINYEEVIANFEAEAKRLIAYCDLPWDSACLAFYQAKRQVRTASFMQVRQPVYTSSVNGWRRFENELAPLIEVLS